MDSKRFALYRTALLAVLEGMTYDAVARVQGVRRTAVERRVKALVPALVKDVGIEGLSETQAKYVRKLRGHRVDVEEALARFRADAAAARTGDDPVLSDADIQRAVRRVRSRTATPELDVAMLWIVLATGLRPLEVARLVVSDYLAADGSVQVRSEVRGAVAVNGRARPLYFSSECACEAIYAHLAMRRGAAVAQMPEPAPAFRGLGPCAPLFVTSTGQAFRIDCVASVSGTRSLCREIHYAYRKIFRRIGIAGLSAMSARHPVVDRLARRGAKERQISDLLGVSEVRPSRRPPLALDELMDGLV